MAGVCRLEIKQTATELKNLLAQQKMATGFERVQALYLLKIGQVQTVKELATAIGRDRTTVQRWLKMYRHQGLEGLLKVKPRPGKAPTLPQWAVIALKARLSDPEGFRNYGEVRAWVEQSLGIEASYKAVYLTVRYKLKAKLKVARPQSRKKKQK